MSSLFDAPQPTSDGAKPSLFDLGMSTGQIISMARSTARRLGVPEDIVLGVIDQESGFKPWARGKAGEVGLMQLMPGTAKMLGVDPFNVQQNVLGGTTYLKGLFRQFGDWTKALAAYNAGPNAVTAGKIPKETWNYVNSVTQNSKKYATVPSSQPVHLTTRGLLETPESQQVDQAARFWNLADTEWNAATPRPGITTGPVPGSKIARFDYPADTLTAALNELNPPAETLETQTGYYGAPPFPEPKPSSIRAMTPEEEAQWAMSHGAQGIRVPLPTDRVPPVSLNTNLAGQAYESGAAGGTANQVLRDLGHALAFGEYAGKPNERLATFIRDWVADPTAGMFGVPPIPEGVVTSISSRLLPESVRALRGVPPAEAVALRSTLPVDRAFVPRWTSATMPDLARIYGGPIETTVRPPAPVAARPPEVPPVTAPIPSGVGGFVPSILQTLGSESGAIRLGAELRFPNVPAIAANALDTLRSFMTPVETTEARANPGFLDVRLRAIGERNLFVTQSHLFLEDTIRPQIARFAVQAGDNPENTAAAMSLYVDSLRNPAAAEAAIPQALANFPEYAPIVERMRALTDPEKALAMTLNTYDQHRGMLRDREGIQEGYIEYHLNHIWQRTAEGRTISAGPKSPLSRFSQWSRQRTIPTFLEGMAQGLKPQTLDIVTINRIADLDTARVLMANRIGKAMTEGGVGKWYNVGDRTEPMALDMVNLGAKDPFNFQRRFPFVGKDGEAHMVIRDFWVTKGAFRTIEHMVQQDPLRGAWAGQNPVGSILKYFDLVKMYELTGSFFHDFNLAKVLIFSRPFAVLRAGFRAEPGYRAIGAVAQGLDWLANPTPSMERLIRMGLVTGRENMMDAYWDLKGISRAWLDNPLMKARSRALWETLHPGLKAFDAMTTFNDAAERFVGRIDPRTGAPFTLDEIARQVAEYANDKYGGLNWDIMGTTPFMKRLFRFFMLAPDWSISNVRLGLSALQPGPRGWAARRSLFGTILTLGSALQAVNWMTAHHFTWQNEPGHEHQIQLPWKDKDGRNLYSDALMPGEFRDILRFFVGLLGRSELLGHANPWDTGVNRIVNPDADRLLQIAQMKSSPLLRTLIGLFSGVDWRGEKFFPPGSEFSERVLPGLEFAAKNIAPVPFPLQALYEMLRGQIEPVQAISSASGAGAIQRGAIASERAWRSFPLKGEFLATLTPDEKKRFLGEIRTGRVTGSVAEKFREFYSRYRYKLLEQELNRPSSQRYAPVGKPKRGSKYKRQPSVHVMPQPPTQRPPTVSGRSLFDVPAVTGTPAPSGPSLFSPP